jgi:hypothetical protein
VRETGGDGRARPGSGVSDGPVGIAPTQGGAQQERYTPSPLGGPVRCRGGAGAPPPPGARPAFPPQFPSGVDET